MPQHPTYNSFSPDLGSRKWPLSLPVRLAISKDEDKQPDKAPPSPFPQQENATDPTTDREKSIVEVVRELERKDQEELLAVLNQILGRS